MIQGEWRLVQHNATPTLLTMYEFPFISGFAGSHILI